MIGYAYLFALAWSTSQAQEAYEMALMMGAAGGAGPFGGGAGLFGGGAARGAAGGAAGGPRGGIFGQQMNPWLASIFPPPCNPGWGQQQPHRGRQTIQGGLTAPTRSAGLAPRAGGPPPGQVGFPRQSPNPRMNIGQMMMGMGVIDIADAPDIPSFPIMGANGQMQMSGCFCQNMADFGECMNFITGMWRQDSCGAFMCCQCQDFMGFKKRR